MIDWTTVAVAIAGSVATLIAATQDQLFGHRLHRRRKIEDLRLERDGKERDAIYELFARLPELEAAAWEFIRSGRTSDEAHVRLSSTFAAIRPHRALLRDEEVGAAVGRAVAAVNQLAESGEATTSLAREAIEMAEAVDAELSPISTLMRLAMSALAQRLEELYA